MFTHLCSHQDPSHIIKAKPLILHGIPKSSPSPQCGVCAVPSDTYQMLLLFLPLINIHGDFLVTPMGLKASRRMEITTHTLYPLSLACSKYGVLDEWPNE